MFSTHDLHTHSTASDGTLSPGDLVGRAAAAGLRVLALTDHDTTGGIAEAQAAALGLGIELVPGVEISVTWNGQTIHLVGLRIDPQDPSLLQGLQGLCDFRDWRAEEIGRRLEKVGIPGACAGARALSNGRLVSRTHFARFLARNGVVADERDVFKRYLVQGKPGHVPGQWAELGQAVSWILGAGGQAVLAHPARYKMTASKRRRLIGAFRDAGGLALEVVSGSHSRDECFHMAQLVQEFQLLASAGSDYHGPECPWIALGRLPTLPGSCVPLWRDWPPLSSDELRSVA
jgi:predicted metal-dependent phosphoesterase TrpH